MIDGVAVMHLTSFMSAVKAMFSSYYVFNIEYPERGHLALEFMQRYVKYFSVMHPLTYLVVRMMMIVPLINWI